jgi:hypothetical protein
MSELSTLSDAELLQLHAQLSRFPTASPPAPAQDGPQDTPGASSGPLRLTVTPKGSNPKPLSEMTNDELLAVHQAAKAQAGPGVIDDVAKTIPSALVRGAAMVAGAPADATKLAFRFMEGMDQTLKGETDEQYATRVAERKASAGFDANKLLEPFTSQSITGAIERNVTGPLHHPKTLPGKYANTAAEFVPGALLGPGGMVRNAISYGALPGLASEAAGQWTEGKPSEPWARGLAGLTAGGAAAVWNRPANVGRSIQQGTEGATAAQLDAAEQLFQQAHAMGAPITRPEAVQQITGGVTRLGDLQRVVEGSGQLRPTFAQRPAQNEAAARRAFDALEPNPSNAPHSIGPGIGDAAQSTLRDVERARTNAVDPFYRAAAVDQVPHPAMQRFIGQLDTAMASDRTGIIGQKLGEIKRLLTDTPAQAATPAQRVPKQTPAGQIYTTVPGQAAKPATYLTNIENLDRVRKYVRDQMDLPQIGKDAITKEQGRAILGSLDALHVEMTQASPSFARGNQLYQDISEQFVRPVFNGPLGKLAEKDLPTQKAIEALFPRNPLPNSADEISNTMTALAQRNQWAARQLVRAHAESVFNQASRNLQSGPAQFGGAGFAAAIRGNPQQAENLATAVRAVYGEAAWKGFDRFLQVLEAQGTRQRIGSQTTFNTEMLGELRRGNAVGEAVLQASTVGLNLPRKVKDTVERWRLGRNVDELANLFANPEAGKRFRQLAEAPAGSSQAGAIATRLVYLATQPSRAQPAAPANR